MPFPPQSPTSSFPYQVEARIGEGAMGVVYRAVEPSLERRVVEEGDAGFVPVL
jgi:serine/threonine protein kinase